MSTQDECCSIHPYFQVHEGQMDAFKDLCERFVARTGSETGCHYYGFTFNGNQMHCREAYHNADGMLAHLENIGDLLEEALQISDITRLEVHGPEHELNKLREPLADFSPEFWVLEYGIRNNSPELKTQSA